MSRCLACCSWKRLIAAILIVSAVVVIVSLAVYVLLLYRGASMTLAPGDVRLLNEHINTFFCQNERVQLSSSDKGRHFNASVVPGDKLSNKIEQTVQINVSPTLDGGHGRAFWRFFLPAGSKINVRQCTTDTSGDSVMSFIFKGHDIDEDCIKHMSGELSSNHSSKIPSYNDKSCTEIILRRYLVKRCARSMQKMDASTTQDDYYLVLYDSISPVAVEVIANISLTRLTYDRRSSLANCSSSDSCELPLRFGSSDTVIAEVPMTAEENEVVLNWSCSPRSATFGIIFAGVPLFLFLLIISTCYCMVKRRQQKNFAVSQAEPINEESERKPLLEEAEVQPSMAAARTSYGAVVQESNYPVLSKTGPIPGPYQYVPSAPPTLPPELSTPPHEDQPFAFPRELPPTYEESQKKVKQKSQRRAEMV